MQGPTPKLSGMPSQVNKPPAFSPTTPNNRTGKNHLSGSQWAFDGEPRLSITNIVFMANAHQRVSPIFD